MNKKDSKHNIHMNRHKIYHKKFLNAWSKKSEKAANAKYKELTGFRVRAHICAQVKTSLLASS